MAKRLVKRPKTMIGWEEWCSLPALGLPAVCAKIDTGAYTSALHAFDIETFDYHGHIFVRFKIHPLERDKNYTVVCEAPLIDKRTITSSNGEREYRPVIKTDIRIGESIINTELTLTSRHKMKFRMLLGRRALKRGRLAVDPGKSFLLGKLENPKALYRSRKRKTK
ncbi:MAG: ATP-dependent zinc protease [Alphaproteobacteria bacterium]|nr:ATP-dependent zinc protease [Alphaproteobacteria bacterium]